MLTVLTIPLQFFNYVLAEITGGSLNRLTIDGITSLYDQGANRRVGKFPLDRTPTRYKLRML